MLMICDTYRKRFSQPLVFANAFVFEAVLAVTQMCFFAPEIVQCCVARPYRSYYVGGWVGADVAAAFNPETPRQFILLENESVLAKKISNLKKSLCCVHLHTASQNSTFIYPTFIFFNFWLSHEFFFLNKVTCFELMNSHLLTLR